MSISTPIDVTTPATRRRQQLAQSLQAQYVNTKGAQRKAMAAVHAVPLFAGAGGARNSLTLPNAPMPQLTFPFLQSHQTQQNLGVVNPAAPDAPTVSQAPGQGAPGFGNPDLPQGIGAQPNMGVTNPQDPNAPTPPQAGDGTYANGQPGTGPIADPNQILSTFGQLPSVRRLYPQGRTDPFGLLKSLGANINNMGNARGLGMA